MKKAQKTFCGFNGIRTYDLRDTSVSMLYQLSFEVLLRAGQEWVQLIYSIPVIWREWDNVYII